MEGQNLIVSDFYALKKGNFMNDLYVRNKNTARASSTLGLEIRTPLELIADCC